MLFRKLLLITLMMTGAVYAMEQPGGGVNPTAQPNGTNGKPPKPKIDDLLDDVTKIELPDELKGLAGTPLENLGKRAAAFFKQFEGQPDPNAPDPFTSIMGAVMQKQMPAPTALKSAVNDLVKSGTLGLLKSFCYKMLLEAKDEDEISISPITEQLENTFGYISQAYQGKVKLMDIPGGMTEIWGPKAKQLVDGLRKTKKGTYATMALNALDTMLNRPVFPIKDDKNLPNNYGQTEWSLACHTGNNAIIQHFIEKEEYAHFLNMYDGSNKPLSWAAFGYINGKAGDVSGFKMLAEKAGIEPDFQIKAGYGTIAFDQWLLLEASYSNDSEKQARLDEVKTVLKATLSGERIAALNFLSEQRDSDRAAKEASENKKREKRNNRLTFFGGTTLGFALLYYLYGGSNKAADEPAKQK